MKLLIALLAALFILLQFKLWVGKDGVQDVMELQSSLELQQNKNNELKQRNDVLQAEVDDLKTGLEVIEARARSELGMVKEGETFIHIVESDSSELGE